MSHSPSPRDESTRNRLRRQGQRNTRPELALRRELHRRGLRFRVEQRPDPRLRTKADIVFRGKRLAIFVDGCFWHACPEHGTSPRNNASWWADKLQANSNRDRAATAALQLAGWSVIRIWEHETAVDAADRIEDLLRPADCRMSDDSGGERRQ